MNCVDDDITTVVESWRLKFLREKWNCDMCWTWSVRMLQEDLQNALWQIDELKSRNRELEAKWLLAGAGKRETVSAMQKFKKCIVVSDPVFRIVGAEHADLMFEWFQGIQTVELHRVINKMDLDCPENFVIHVCTNDLRTKRNLGIVFGEVYTLVATAKRKLPICRLSWVECCDVEMCHGGVLGH